MKTIVPLLIAGAAVALAGCSTTKLKMTTKTGETYEVTATTFLVKRNLGQVRIGEASLGTSNSEQMQLAADAVALAAKAMKP